MIRKKTIELQGIPEPIWAVIRAVAATELDITIAAFCRQAIYAAAKKKNPHLWEKATNAVRKARGIPHAMTIINPSRETPSD